MLKTCITSDKQQQILRINHPPGSKDSGLKNQGWRTILKMWIEMLVTAEEIELHTC